jgi:hypothetical protein
MNVKCALVGVVSAVSARTSEMRDDLVAHLATFANRVGVVARATYVFLLAVELGRILLAARTGVISGYTFHPNRLYLQSQGDWNRTSVLLLPKQALNRLSYTLKFSLSYTPLKTRRRDSNPRGWLCRPPPNHSATARMSAPRRI